MQYSMLMLSFVIDLVISKKLQIRCGSEAVSTRTSCYFTLNSYDDIGELNPSDNFTFPRDSIFFIETSCNGGLNYRQACSVESAARAHPDRQINVLFAGPLHKKCLEAEPLWALFHYDNVRVARIHLKRYLRNTPLHDFLSFRNFFMSQYRVHHTSDILRFVTMFKYGGIYLDLDVIIVKSLDTLPYTRNWVGRQSAHRLSSALLSFTHYGIGRWISEEVLRRLRRKYKYYSLEYNNNEILEEVLLTGCNADSIKQMKTDLCYGFTVYHEDFFYPISINRSDVYFQKFYGALPKKWPFAFHLWNIATQHLRIYDDSLYNHLIKTFCPKISYLMHNLD